MKEPDCGGKTCEGISVSLVAVPHGRRQAFDPGVIRRIRVCYGSLNLHERSRLELLRGWVSGFLPQLLSQRVLNLSLLELQDAQPTRAAAIVGAERFEPLAAPATARPRE